MGSKGRIPPYHMRHPLPGPGMMHPDPLGAGMRPPPGGFPPVEFMPPPEIMEQKLASQHVEMERLATENQRLASTHGALRQQLAAAQQELQMLESQTQAAKTERELQIRGLVEKISKMEVDLQAGDRLKLDLQQARTEAQSLAEVRQELLAKVQLMNTELQRAHLDVQQVPALMSELNILRQEFHQCRATYEHERKVYRDHLESLQIMDKEYKSMAEEVARLRTQLSNTANTEKRPAYGGTMGYGEVDASVRKPSTQSSYEGSHAVAAQQVQASFPASGAAVAPVAASSSGGAPTYAAPQVGVTNGRAAYDVSRTPVYEVQRGPSHESARGPAYEPQGGQVYNAQRASGYEAYRGVNYDTQRPPPYDPQRAAAYEIPRATNYDAHSRGGALPPPQAQPATNTVPYGSAARTGTGIEAQSRVGNAARK